MAWALSLASCSAPPPPPAPEAPARAHEVSKPPSVPPAIDYRTQIVEYAGPDDDAPAPGDLEEVRLGWFGPADPAHPTGGALWQGANLAVEEANAAGGLDGKPFRLVPRWSENPWGTGIQGVVRLVYEDEVWALLGAPDSASSHLVEQVVAKARVLFVSPVATENSGHLTNVPWIFSVAPPDAAIAAALADSLDGAAREARGRGETPRLVLVSGADHDSRRLAAEVLAALKGASIYPVLHVQIRIDEPEMERALRQVAEADASMALVLAGPRDSARAAAEVFRVAPRARLWVGPQAGRREFLAAFEPGVVRSASTRIPRPVLWDPEAVGERARDFARRYRERFGEPDQDAAYAYDATRLAIEAIRRAGLHRVRIRDALRAIPPTDGVTGPIAWDPTGRRTGVAVRVVAEEPRGRASASR